MAMVLSLSDTEREIKNGSSTIIAKCGDIPIFTWGGDVSTKDSQTNSKNQCNHWFGGTDIGYSHPNEVDNPSNQHEYYKGKKKTCTELLFTLVSTF